MLFHHTLEVMYLISFGRGFTQTYSSRHCRASTKALTPSEMIPEPQKLLKLLNLATAVFSFMVCYCLLMDKIWVAVFLYRVRTTPNKWSTLLLKLELEKTAVVGSKREVKHAKRGRFQILNGCHSLIAQRERCSPALPERHAGYVL